MISPSTFYNNKGDLDWKSYYWVTMLFKALWFTIVIQFLFLKYLIEIKIIGIHIVEEGMSLGKAFILQNPFHYSRLCLLDHQLAPKKITQSPITSFECLVLFLLALSA